MKYNFDKKINRYVNHSTKWTEMHNAFISNDLLPFWIADMDFETCPHIQEAMQEKINQNIYGYVHTKESYFESAKDFTKRRHGYDMDIKTIAHSPSVALSLALCVRLYTEITDKIMISTPVYAPFHECVLQNDRQLVTSNLKVEDGKYVIDFEDFEKKASDENLRWYILCNPHNPTGRVWTKEELQKIADICIKHNVRVISDEIWRDLVFKNNKFTHFASLSKEVEDITITCFSATKTFNLAGLQASLISIPRKKELEKFRKELGILHLNRNNSFNVVACEAAFNNGEEWLEELLVYLEENLNFTQKFLETNLPKIKFIRPEGTFVLWLDFSDYEIEDIYLFMQINAKVALDNGAKYDKLSKQFLRLNFACPRYILEEGLKRIQKALENK